MLYNREIDTKEKVIGTLVPMGALTSSCLIKKDQGTFAAGLFFLDWLKKTGQSGWQLLPLHPTQLEQGSSSVHVPSPYKSYGVGLDPRYLPSAFAKRFPTEQELAEFREENKEWISDFVFFCALRDHFGTDDWRDWEKDVRNRDKKTLEVWEKKLTKEITTHLVVQWQLHAAYMQLKNKAKSLDMMLIGDMPFYLAIQSPLVWVNQDLFHIPQRGEMRYVSGVTNSSSSHFGRQVWGHPLYKWEELQNRKKILALWKIRLRYLATIFDAIRIDHAKAFFQYSAIDANNPQLDQDKKGPGEAVFQELAEFSSGIGLLLFAEDSGSHLRELRKVLRKLNIAGIKIFRFAFDEKKDTVIDEYAHIEDYVPRTVVYTTTHDTETLCGYLHILTIEQKEKLASASRVPYSKDDKEFAKNLRDALLQSPANTIIIPIQDWLLTTERINVPGTERPVNDPNWRYLVGKPIEEFPTVF